ncbi:MAG TPA: 30S ribosome-binding factor RbfA [Planctomycetota bacterium]|nr:30S ribosome-binding factor RbfA [Planctomycetota bacterium]
MNPIRLAQLSSRIQERLAEVLSFEMKDPRSRFVTVTHVKLAKDLTQCVVFYSVLGDEKDRALVGHMLDHAKGFLERQVRAVLATRVSPHLFFKYDESIEGAIQLGRKIDEVVAHDRELAAAAGREPGVLPDGAPEEAPAEPEPPEKPPPPPPRKRSRRT